MFAVFVVQISARYYEEWKAQKEVNGLAEEMKRLEVEYQIAITADTIGGKTPQETLEMFITAVEVGNYELASKYFVIGKQGEELESLQNSSKENIKNVMGLLGVAIGKKGAYLSDNKYFIDEPLSIDFVKYPSGNWKIEEI